MSIMQYSKGTGVNENWLVEESAFDSRYLGKCEAIFCQGNGYMGVRAALEEEYVSETRNMFVTGTFNKFHDTEVTELPNFPDVTKIIFQINGKAFSLDQGIIHHYERVLNLKNGEVTRIVDWESKDGERIEFKFLRIVSMKDEHVIASKVELKPISGDIALKIISGIDGTVSNSGSQHFAEGSKRLYDFTYLEMVSETIESKVTAAIHTAHRFYLNSEEVKVTTLPVIGRREIKINASIELKKDQVLVLEKISTVHTTRDLVYDGMEAEESIVSVKVDGKKNIEEAFALGYDKILSESAKAWEEIWNQEDIQIDSVNPFDQLAMRFGIYHLNIMVKKDDNRVGIGAKALSGEGYKGHSFWDTEVFILPYYLMTQPKTARTLLEYRYKNLYGARLKAREQGYEGAMYPWESAWIDDGEVTPLWGAADVVTGETLKILTGIIEQHITADIAFAVWQYYIVTRDEEFMNLYGYEMIMDTARFWASRLEWNEAKNQYEINDVIGPDEYKEHVNNNVYTNYLAYYNMNLALELIGKIRENNTEVYDRINGLFSLTKLEEDLGDKLPKLYLPKPDKDTGIIPQFDGYFDLKYIDLTKYKQSTIVGTIYNDYNMEQINEFQVLKQGDLVVLLYLLDDLFDAETKRKNYMYYEERTLHDSSLSKSTHSVLANDLGLHEDAYHFFVGASSIDLGEEMKSSDAGIHSASMGGIWQSAVLGFGGVRVVGQQLRIAPSLPKEWNSLSFRVVWRGTPLKVTVTKETVSITNLAHAVEILVYDEVVDLEGNATFTTKVRG